MKLSSLIPCSFDTEITDIAVDTRLVQKGSLFVCISGVRVDAHQFAAQAEELGAAAILAEKDVEVKGIPVVRVENTRAALPRVMSAFLGHPEKKFRLIGVTGTNGKTSSTHFLKSILEAEGRTVGLIGTNHNLIGNTELPSTHTTPDSVSLFRLFAKMAELGATDVVMEMSSHALDQHRADADFTLAGITNLTQDHLDYHGTMEAYGQAKKRLFSMAEKAVYNADDPAVCALLADVDALTFGINAGDVRAENIVNKPTGVTFDVDGVGYRLAIPGRFSVYNALLAIALARSLGCSTETIQKGLAAVEGVSGRAEVVPADLPFTVMIDYAHTPDGIEKILNAAREFTEGELWILFGCGGDRDNTKRPKMGAMAEKLADRLVVTSDNPRSEDPEAIIAEILTGISDRSRTTVLPDRTEAIAYALAHAKAGDVVVLAGKGHETYQVLKEGKIHYDEREVIRQILEG